MEQVNPMIGGMSLPLQREHIEALANDHNVGLVVSCIEIFNAPPAEFFEGVDLHHMIVDWRDRWVPPVREMIMLMEQVRKTIQEGKKVVFHCFAGKGRTGTSIACSILALSPPGTFTPEQVIDLVRAQRPGSIETKGQEDFIINSFGTYILSAGSSYSHPHPQDTSPSPSSSCSSSSLSS